MRLPATLAVGLLLIGKVTAQSNAVNATALAELSPCVTQCSTPILTKYGCSPTDSCFCENKQLANEIGTCISSCPFADQLGTTRFQASTCNRPVRNFDSIEFLYYLLFGLSTMFTIARILSRLPKLGGAGLGWDDSTAMVSYIVLSGVTVCDWYALHSGGGVDVWGLSLQEVHDFVKWFYLCTVLYTPVLFATKASLILLYLRVWPAKSSRFRIVCWVTLGLLLAGYVAFQVVAIVQCKPIDFQWARLTDPGRKGTCIDREAWIWSLAATVIVFDLTVLLLPIPKLFNLEVPGSRKAGLCAVFLVGLIVTAFSFVRLRYVRGFTTHPNPTRYYSYVGIYSNFELHLSQICCCMPTVPGLVRRTYRYFIGQAPVSSNIALSSRRWESKNPALRISRPIQIEEHEDSRSIDKPPLTASNASTYSASSGAPAPIVHRHSNPFQHYSNPLIPGPSVFANDCRATGRFHGGGSRDEEQDVAMPSPAIPRGWHLGSGSGANGAP